MIGIKAGAKFIGAALLMAELSGCGGDGGASEQAVPLETYTPQQIFERGEFEMNRRRFEDGAKYFGEVERLYPYSDWARRALMILRPALVAIRDRKPWRRLRTRFEG